MTVFFYKIVYIESLVLDHAIVMLIYLVIVYLDSQLLIIVAGKCLSTNIIKSLEVFSIPFHWNL